MLDSFIPYGCQQIDETDVQAVISALQGSYITCGPSVDAFEVAMASTLFVSAGVAVSSGTAALHLALTALDIGPGDEVIVPALTFAATATTVLMCGAVPVVVDVSPDTGLIAPDQVASAITMRTRAVIAVDYTGALCDYDALHALLDHRGIPLIADACHALGGMYQGKPVGRHALMTALSFHPVKHLTTGEGGMVMTDDAALAGRLRRLRNHGIDRDAAARQQGCSFEYDVVELGFNYRLSDLQCALGISQLKKLAFFVARRREIAVIYDQFFAQISGIDPLIVPSNCKSAYHLYVVRVDPESIDGGRDRLFSSLLSKNIGTNVHYKPLHRLSALKNRIHLGTQGCEHAESLYSKILSLPMYPGLSTSDMDRVLDGIRHAIE